MTSRVRHAFAVLAGAALTLVACGDDGNDQALRTRSAAERAAEFRAAQTTTTVAVMRPAAESTDAAAPPTTAAPITPVAPTGEIVPVVALDNSFRPEVVEIEAGDEVLWENRGANEHNVLPVDGARWGVEVDGFQPGDVYAHVFTEPGEYRYYCSIHGNEDVGMVGTVIVGG